MSKGAVVPSCVLLVTNRRQLWPYAAERITATAAVTIIQQSHGPPLLPYDADRAHRPRPRPGGSACPHKTRNTSTHNAFLPDLRCRHRRTMPRTRPALAADEFCSVTKQAPLRSC